MAGTAEEAAQGSGGWDGAEAHWVPKNTQLTEWLRVLLASSPAAQAAQDSQFPSQPTGQRRNPQRPVRSVSPGKLSRRLRRARHQAPGYHGLQDSLRSLHLHGRYFGAPSSWSGMGSGSQHWGRGQSEETGN